MQDDLDARILALARSSRRLAGDAPAATGLSRVAASRRIARLADAQYLLRHGSGTRQTYSVGPRRFWLATLLLTQIRMIGGEAAVWDMHVAPLFSGIRPNVQNIANICFTEMLNNVLDHSAARKVCIGIHVSDGRLQMAVMDDGVGIFRKIAKGLDLFDPRLAILELAKGKYTSAPEGHSGMGVFVSSRMLDGFLVHSRGLSYAPRAPVGVDLSFSWIDVHEYAQGTVVLMDIAIDSQRTAQSVYEKYFSADEVGESGFHTTEVPVKLAQLSSQLTSRSQAKWVLHRATQFRTVILDFDDVELVGQAFVDEVFRVFASAQPEIRLLTRNVSPAVANTIALFAPHVDLG